MVFDLDKEYFSETTWVVQHEMPADENESKDSRETKK